MGTFWQDVKSSVKKGVSTAADKTEEYGKIGKVKLDIMNLNKQLDKTFKDLGEKAYETLKAKSKANLADDSAVKDMVAKIDELKKNVIDKEAEIEKIKAEADTKKETKGKADTAAKKTE
jgi:hypothetical protein